MFCEASRVLRNSSEEHTQFSIDYFLNIFDGIHLLSSNLICCFDDVYCDHMYENIFIKSLLLR